jgi:hypothetical protein
MFRTLSLVAAALGMFGLSALAAEPEPKPDAKMERAHIRTFSLKKVEVSDALEAFNALTGPARATQMPPLVPPEASKKNTGEIQDNISYYGIKADVVAIPIETFQSYPSVIFCRALGDPRTRSLIVRGVEKHLQLAADLVAILDTPDNKPLPEVKSLKAFRLQHLDANDFVGIMEKLNPNLNYHLVSVGRLKLVLARGSDEQMNEVAEAVKELDIPPVMK